MARWKKKLGMMRVLGGLDAEGDAEAEGGGTVQEGEMGSHAWALLLARTSKIATEFKPNSVHLY